MNIFLLILGGFICIIIGIALGIGFLYLSFTWESHAGDYFVKKGYTREEAEQYIEKMKKEINGE